MNAIAFSPAVFLLWGAVSSASAGAPTGAAFLGVTPSARAYSLGMAHGITALGAEAIGSNPANMGLMTQRGEFFSSYASLLDGTHLEHAALALALDDGVLGTDALGVSITRLGSAGFETADGSGNRTGSSFGASDTAVSLSASSRLETDLRIGLTGKLLQSRIAGYSSELTPAADFGVTYTLSELRKPVSIGLSVTNVGRGVRWLQQADKLPTAVNLGAAMPLGPAMAVLEINRRVNERVTVGSVGMEFGLGAVSFRAGYLVQRQAGPGPARNPLFGGLSGGIGVKIAAARLDYAMSQQGEDYGTTHRVALSLRWGQRAEPSARPSPNSEGWILRY